MDCDIQTIPNKNLKSTTSFYNKSPFSEVDLIVKYEKLPSNDGRKVITNYTRILNDTVLVMEYMFNTLIKRFKRSYGDKYEYVVGQIADLCVNFDVSITDDGFAVTFDFGGARNCNKIEKLLIANMRGAFCYIQKDGKSKIKLS